MYLAIWKDKRWMLKKNSIVDYCIVGRMNKTFLKLSYKIIKLI